MTEPPQDPPPGPPPLLPFRDSGQPPGWQPPQSGEGYQPVQPYGQPAQPYGQPAQPAAQPYGAYQPHPGMPYAGAQPVGYPPGRDPALAQWWRRLLARIIDGLAISALLTPLWIPAMAKLLGRLQGIASQYPNLAQPGALAAYNSQVNGVVTSMTQTFAMIGLAGVLVTFCYDWLQHGLWGQTLGKRALGTIVVMAGTRSRLTLGAAGIRAAVYALPGLVPYAGSAFELLDAGWLLWDPRRQCLHDKAARTIVIRKDMLAPAAAPAGAPLAG